MWRLLVPNWDCERVKGTNRPDSKVSRPGVMTSIASESGSGGEGGIRTHGAVARTPHFECGAFDHSATSPLEQALADRSRLLVVAGH